MKKCGDILDDGVERLRCLVLFSFASIYASSHQVFKHKSSDFIFARVSFLKDTTKMETLQIFFEVLLVLLLTIYGIFDIFIS